MDRKEFEGSTNYGVQAVNKGFMVIQNDPVKAFEAKMKIDELKRRQQAQEAEIVDAVVVDSFVNGEADEEEPLDDVLFNPHVFNKNEYLVKAKEELAKSINLGGEGAKDRVRIDPTVQSQWYYIEKAIRESDVKARSFQTKQFIEQMMTWFPGGFDRYETDEKRAEAVTKIGASISAEKRLWKNGTKEVSIVDMKAHAREFCLDSSKTTPLSNLCMQLKKALNNLKAVIEKTQN